MRILNQDQDRSLSAVTFLLTQQDARQMLADIESFLDCENPEVAWHSHISSEDYKKEITVSFYEIDKLKGFAKRCEKLILENI